MAYRQHVRRALQGVAAGRDADDSARLTVLQIEATVSVIERLMGWPIARLKELRPPATRGRQRGGY